MSRRLLSQVSAQKEADRRLLKYGTYEEYLSSLTTIQDQTYLDSLEVSLTIAELGYRCSGETLSREEFEKRSAAAYLYLYPPYKPYESFSEGITRGDQLQKELALRERGNRVGILSTIIFVRYKESCSGISGYMDYGDKLTTEDWKPFFRECHRFTPKEEKFVLNQKSKAKRVLNRSDLTDSKMKYGHSSRHYLNG